MAPAIVGWMGKVANLKILSDIEPSVCELRIRKKPERKIPRYKVSSLQTHVASIRPHAGYDGDDAVRIGCLVVRVGQPALEASGCGKAQIKLWLVCPHG